MKTIATLIKSAALMLALTLSGCNKADTHEQVLTDMISQIQSAGTTLASAKDAASADAAKAKLTAAAGEIGKLVERAKKLGTPDKAKMDALKPLLGDKMEAAMKTMGEQAGRVSSDATLKSAKEGLDAFGNAMKELMGVMK